MRRDFFLYAIAAAISLSFASGAKAGVCASTFGAGSSFGGGVYAVSGSGSGVRFDRAFSFTPSVDCRLGTIDIAFHLDGGTNGLSISVVEDASGLPGSTVVESTAVIDEMTTDPLGSIVTGMFTGANLLSGSITYWIVVEAEPVTGNTSAVWHVNPDSLTGVRGLRTNAGSWQGSLGVLGAFRVTEPVQVPALSYWGRGVVGAALLVLAGLSARRRTRGNPGRYEACQEI